MRSMRVTVIPVVIGEYGTILNGSGRGLEKLIIRGRIETIQTTELLRSAGIMQRIHET